MIDREACVRRYRRDTLGRIERVDTVIAEAGGFNRSYVEQTTFDQFGRVFQQFDAAGGNPDSSITEIHGQPSFTRAESSAMAS